MPAYTADPAEGAAAPTLADIEQLVCAECGVNPPLAPGTRMEEDLGITGDDYFELMDAYAERFGVDMSGFLWYFHCVEEVSFNPGAWFCAPPYKRVARISITLEHLLAFARRGKWDIAYPPHTLARRRYDILITQLMYFIPLLAALVLLYLKA